MTTQPTLDLTPLDVPDYAPELTIAERFALFHEANPHVADALDALAGQWLARHQRVGMKAVTEALRWRTGIETTDSSPWRLNNNYTSLYARLLLDRHPEWAGRIETRALATERT